MFNVRATQSHRCTCAFLSCNCPALPPGVVVVKLTAVQCVYLSKHLHGCSVRSAHLLYHNTGPLTSGTVCPRHVGFMKAEMILLLPPSLFPSLIHRPPRSPVSSALSCGGRSAAVSPPGGGNRCSGRRGRGRDEQPQPGCILPI